MEHIDGMAPELVYPVRKLINLTEELAERIANYRFASRLASENEAIRQLIEAGLTAVEAPSATDGRTAGRKR
jgi:hypothetical protein